MPLRIIRNDLLKMEVDAIVNPTDSLLSGSGSIDFKIHLAGEEALQKELDAFGKCNVGDAILTHAYNLPCEYIIHTVGPIWNGDAKVFKAIESCYRHCLEIALDQDFESIAFPLIATGSFGCPTDKAIQIAINTITHDHHGIRRGVLNSIIQGLSLLSNRRRDRLRKRIIV